MTDVPKRPGNTSEASVPDTLAPLTSSDFNLEDAKRTAREYKARAGLSDPERELKNLKAEHEQKEPKRRVY